MDEFVTKVLLVLLGVFFLGGGVLYISYIIVYFGVFVQFSFSFFCLFTLNK